MFGTNTARTNWLMRIVLVYPNRSTFIEKDAEILASIASLEEIELKTSVQGLGLQFLINLLRLVMEIRRSDLVYVWFSDLHALISLILTKMFKKRSIIVLGGYEVANFPKYNYGLMRNALLKLLVWIPLNLADLIVPVACHIERKIEELGIPKNKIITIHTGYEETSCHGNREDLILTVGPINNGSRIFIKGIDRFLKAAKALPRYRFKVVGVAPRIKEILAELAPDNLELVGFLNKDELRNEYCKAKVYCQLSRSEGLPNAMAEAMASGCAVVGSNIDGIAELVGDAGILVDPDSLELTRGIEEALKRHKELGNKARARIKLFSLEKRRKLLKEVVTMLLSH